jgi:hypothetical protein
MQKSLSLDESKPFDLINMIEFNIFIIGRWFDLHKLNISNNNNNNNNFSLHTKRNYFLIRKAKGAIIFMISFLKKSAISMLFSYFPHPFYLSPLFYPKSALKVHRFLFTYILKKKAKSCREPVGPASSQRDQGSMIYSHN